MRKIPRIPFGHFPTPIEPLPRLSEYLGGPSLSIKRDDQTGLAFGGNKTRKLEFLLAEAHSVEANTLVTVGAIQSNHCRQTVAAAARFGMQCILVLSGEPPEQATGNLLLDQLMGAEIVWTDRQNREATLQETFQRAIHEGRKPFLIPYGGSNPVGATSHVYAMKELLDQESYPDWIVFPSSSGGTQAGLVLGARLFGYRGVVLGVSIDEPEAQLKNIVAELASTTAEFLGESERFTPGDIQVDAGYLGEGYGVMGPGEREAIQLFAQLEGQLLDPVYTGRAAAGLIDRIRKGGFPRDASVLFWHTGGAPALFAERYRDLV